MALTHEQKQEIKQLYDDRKNKVADIAEAFRIEKGVVARIAVELGATPRRPKTYGVSRDGQSGQSQKKCPNCKRAAPIDAAKYCCFCGADIRTPSEKLIEKQQKLLQHFAFIPQAVRDESRDIILETIEYLKKA